MIRFIMAFLSLLILPIGAPAQDAGTHFEAGVFLTGVFLEEIGTRDAGVGTGAAGLGGRLVYRLLPYTDLEGELIVHPNAGVSGYRIQGFFGGKIGKRFERVGLFVKARPGLLYFSKDPFGASSPGSTFPNTNWASGMEASLDLGGVFEYYTQRGLLLRFDLGDTLVNYEPRTVAISQLLPPIQRGGFTTHNTQWSFGLGFRF